MRKLHWGAKRMMSAVGIALTGSSRRTWLVVDSTT